MHIKVSDILDGSVGERRTYTFEGERPEMDDLQLADTISGEVEVMKSDDGVAVRGTAETSLELICHRCMQAFDWPVQVDFSEDFAHHPKDGEEVISAEDTIDLAPTIRQELLVAQPIKVLCREDCPGLCVECGEVNEAGHSHNTKLTKE